MAHKPNGERSTTEESAPNATIPLPTRNAKSEYKKMGRKKKYTRGTEVIALSVDKDIVEFLREQAANHRMSFSAYITEILKIFSKNSLEFAKAKAKSLFSDAYYWKSRIEMLEAGGSDHEKKSDTDTS